MGKILKLLISILICQGAGILGSIFTTPSIPTWYRQLIKPPFTPPNWLFAPAWTLLFLLMGISLYLVWEKGLKDKEVKKALLIFLIQLVLNILWSFIFFTLKSLLFAFIEIVILWIAILLTIIYFYKISKASAYLLLPYLFWVSFASVLNFSILILNR
ncbi:MAG: tryptophan-rich sensory protein [candidate division WOR-3 bacterium]|nr:tryptophan-rich sensory protein [candidate division WOR-3 bacterium]MCX7836796.1 tryptophan-rich sensory protein [candidate division WOR-3 bacterium]